MQQQAHTKKFIDDRFDFKYVALNLANERHH